VVIARILCNPSLHLPAGARAAVEEGAMLVERSERSLDPCLEPQAGCPGAPLGAQGRR
jgi:hypothetical protein